MAYKNGQWRSDRDVRRDNEAKWAKAGVRVGKGGSDIDRAIEAEEREAKSVEKYSREAAMGPPAKSKPISGPPVEPGYATPYPKHGTNHGTLGGVTSWTMGQGDKIDRPIIDGGCAHKGETISLTLSSGKVLYGGQAYKLVETDHLDLIVDCAGLLQGRKFVKQASQPRYRALNQQAYPDVITLAWPDMTAPTQVGIRFWESLLALLPQNTAVCCMGGHGRTGTALAALLIADGVTGNEGRDAIDRVRKEHCARAIETKGQEDYLKGLAKAKLAREQRGK